MGELYTVSGLDTISNGVNVLLFFWFISMIFTLSYIPVYIRERREEKKKRKERVRIAKKQRQELDRQEYLNEVWKEIENN